MIRKTNWPNYTTGRRYFLSLPLFNCCLFTERTLTIFVCLFCWFYIVTVSFFLYLAVISIITHLFMYVFIYFTSWMLTSTSSPVTESFPFSPEWVRDPMCYPCTPTHQLSSGLAHLLLLRPVGEGLPQTAKSFRNNPCIWLCWSSCRLPIFTSALNPFPNCSIIVKVLSSMYACGSLYQF